MQIGWVSSYRRLFFTDATELQADIRALSAIDQILGDQLASCDASARLQHITRQSLQFLQLALEAEQHTVNGRNVFINLDDVPDLYHSRVVSEILLQLERVERVFIEDVGLDPGKQAVGFVITDQALTEEDIGGSAFGSFNWLPVAYTTTFGQAIPQGVRETTVRHEIVHVFMNQIATSRHRVQFPEVFIEGMALYLAENQFVEWQQGNGITLSDDYMLYLDAFREMERVGGDRAVHELIREVLIGQEPGFYARFELITGQSYSSFVGGDLTSLLRIERWVKSRVNALPVGLRYAIVLGFIVLAIAVFVALVDSGKRQVQRNMGVVFILFASFVLISQGRAINYVLENPLGYILVVIIVLSIIAVASTPRRSIYPESDDDDQQFSEDDEDPFIDPF